MTGLLKKISVETYFALRDTAGIALAIVLGVMAYNNGAKVWGVLLALIAYLGVVGYGFVVKDAKKAREDKV